MKIPNYSMTPGLERFPEKERFSVYRATHKRLMKADADYRKLWNSHIIGIICCVIVSTGSYIGGGPLAVSLMVGLPVLTVVAVLFLSFRLQKLMNERIGKVL